MTDTTQKNEIVYLGPIALQGNKTGDLFIPLALMTKIIEAELPTIDDLPYGRQPVEWLVEKIDRQASAFGRPKGAKSARCSSVGSVYMIECDINTETGRMQTISNGNLSIGWTNKRLPSELGANVALAYAGRAKAFRDEDQRIRAEKKAADNPRLVGAIETLQIAYAGVSMQDRMAFRLWVFDQIARGRK